LRGTKNAKVDRVDKVDRGDKGNTVSNLTYDKKLTQVVFVTKY
jgi:hypothetical protein